MAEGDFSDLHVWKDTLEETREAFEYQKTFKDKALVIATTPIVLLFGAFLKYASKIDNIAIRKQQAERRRLDVLEDQAAIASVIANQTMSQEQKDNLIAIFSRPRP